MRHICLLSLLFCACISMQAQLNIVAPAEKEVIDKAPNYVLRFTQDVYQLEMNDYFTDNAVVFRLGSTRQEAGEAIEQLSIWMKNAKTDEFLQIEQDEVAYFIVKVSGSECMFSQGDAEYCKATLVTLVPDMTVYRDFLKSVLCMPHTIGHFSSADLKHIRKALTK